MLKWYFVKAPQGSVKTAVTNLKLKIEESDEDTQKMFGQVLAVMEKSRTLGSKRVKQKSLYPGFFVETLCNDDKSTMNTESYYFIKQTRGVSGFIGTNFSELPIAVSDKDMKQVLEHYHANADGDGTEVVVPEVRADIATGDILNVVDGVFKDYTGVVNSVDFKRRKVSLNIKIFGSQTTPVTLDFDSVKK